MVTWTNFDQSPSEWDSFLLRARDYNVFQSYAWGEYKKKFGWNPLRFIATNNKAQIVGMVQILVKELPFGFGVGWAPGGPILRFDPSIEFSNDILMLLKHLHDLYPRVLIRFHSHVKIDCRSAYEFRKACNRALFKINSGFTVLIDLKNSNSDLQKEMTAKHRYYAKKAISSHIKWVEGVTEKSISDFIDVHRQMVLSKAITSISINYQDLIFLRDILGKKNLTMLIGYIADRPVTSCLTYDFGQRSIYMMAATNDSGRKVSAAYAMIPELLEHLKQKGIETFDFGGIDPGNPNAEGVDHFKKGFGGAIIEHLGEWESANSEALRTILNIGLMKIGKRS
jgi:lipid II:glycine glycyltransferase (peptidoglycan interpeptide bridge formation enzyme)